MKLIRLIFSFLALLGLAGSSFRPETSIPLVNEAEFVCLKTHKASNTCHWNFTVDGGQYRFEDRGCKYNKKRDKLIEKVASGEIILAKDWKIACPQPSTKPTGN